MINYPIYIGTLILSVAILFLLLKYIWKKYLFLKYGFRTRAKVIKVVSHKGNQMVEFGYVPIVEFRARNGKMRVVKTDFFLERFVTNAKLKIGYEFDIIYLGDDVEGMMEIRTLKGVIITYSVVAIFPFTFIIIFVSALF